MCILSTYFYIFRILDALRIYKFTFKMQSICEKSNYLDNGSIILVYTFAGVNGITYDARHVNVFEHVCHLDESTISRPSDNSCSP